jgi:hypothetical protein
MMDQIYLQATSVTVWLGEQSIDSDLAMDFILEVNRNLSSLRSRWNLFTTQLSKAMPPCTLRTRRSMVKNPKMIPHGLLSVAC